MIHYVWREESVLCTSLLVLGISFNIKKQYLLRSKRLQSDFFPIINSSYEFPPINFNKEIYLHFRLPSLHIMKRLIQDAV